MDPLALPLALCLDNYLLILRGTIFVAKTSTARQRVMPGLGGNPRRLTNKNTAAIRRELATISMVQERKQQDMESDWRSATYWSYQKIPYLWNCIAFFGFCFVWGNYVRCISPKICRPSCLFPDGARRMPKFATYPSKWKKTGRLEYWGEEWEKTCLSDTFE